MKQTGFPSECRCYNATPGWANCCDDFSTRLRAQPTPNIPAPRKLYSTPESVSQAASSTACSN